MITRIRQLLDSKELSPTQFADLIGVGRPVVSHILSERNKPSLDVVQRIIGAFPEISLPWLLSGTGNMLNGVIPLPPIPNSITEKGPAAPATEPTQASEPAPAAPTPPPVEQPLNPLVSQAELPLVAAAKPVAPPEPAAKVTSDTVSALVSAVAAPVVKPFRAARFVPAATAAPATAAATAALPPAPPKDEPPPSAPSLTYAVAAPPISPVTEVTAASLPPASSPAETAALPFLLEPGKAIRRIVIFYRDGSFADYQPEQ